MTYQTKHNMSHELPYKKDDRNFHKKQEYRLLFPPALFYKNHYHHIKNILPLFYYPLLASNQC